MKRTMWLLLCVLSAPILLLWIGGSPANGQPSHVYVYNGGLGGVDANGEGYAWQETGLNNTDGLPGKIQGGNIIDNQGNVLGTAIIQNGNTIGWKNAAGTTAVIDIQNNGTLQNAWDLVAANGKITIIKHGWMPSEKDPATGKWRRGGGICLDSGGSYEGFQNGTGVKAKTWDLEGPYQLQGREGANIDLELWTCWGSADPYPEDNNVKSVLESAKDIPGVANVVSTADDFTAGCNWNAKPAVAGITQNQLMNAIQAKWGQFKADPRTAGYKNVTNFVANAPCKDKLKVLREILGTVKIAGQNVPLSWSLKYYVPKNAPTAALFCRDYMAGVRTDLQGESVTLTHQTASGTGLESTASFSSFRDDNDTNTESETLHLSRLTELPYPPPYDITRQKYLTLYTGVYELTAVDGYLGEAQGRFQLDYLRPPDGLPEPVWDSFDLYRFDSDSAWEPITLEEEINSYEGWISVWDCTGEIGRQRYYAYSSEDCNTYIIAGFAEPTPEPASALLILLGMPVVYFIRRRHEMVQ